MFFRFIFYSILFYIVMKVASIVWQYFKQLNDKDNPKVNNSRNKEYTINKKDIIDAEFEDITEKENTNE